MACVVTICAAIASVPSREIMTFCVVQVIGFESRDQENIGQLIVKTGSITRRFLGFDQIHDDDNSEMVLLKALEPKSHIRGGNRSPSVRSPSAPSRIVSMNKLSSSIQKFRTVVNGFTSFHVLKRSSKGMSSGPFGEGAEADLISEEINRYFAETGFIATLAGFFKFLLSIPNRPDQPTLALLEMLEIPHERLDINAKMAILHETRSELVKAVELNSKLKMRHDELRKMLVNGQQTTCGQLGDYDKQHENQRQ
uniref:Lon N-terminal domain-containing protein n=1 Tax=Angiostrongylus cantonensis TaxID=6313 RepID=A0A158PCL1_ANGCA